MKKPIVSPFPKYLPKDPLLKDLPHYLKEPKNFDKVYKSIYEAGVSKCTHSEVTEYAKCKKCVGKFWERAEFMRKLGFTSGKQYLTWLKIHQRIKDMKAGKKNIKGEYYDDK